MIDEEQPKVDVQEVAEEKKQDLADEYDIVDEGPDIAKEESKGMFDDAEVYEAPAKETTLDDAKATVDKYIKDSKKLIDDALNSKNISPEEKQAQLKAGLASIMAAQTMNSMLDKVGEHMDGEQLESLVDQETFKGAIKDTFGSREFQKLYESTPENAYKALIRDDQVGKDMLGSMEKHLNEYTQDFAKKDLEAKQQKAPQQNQQEVDGFEIVNM